MVGILLYNLFAGSWFIDSSSTHFFSLFHLYIVIPHIFTLSFGVLIIVCFTPRRLAAVFISRSGGVKIPHRRTIKV